jgi:stage V sporulation protein R
MQIIDQHTKAIMEECKRRSRNVGLSFDDESLEYVVTNRDLIELSPKVMIPTLYDYWANDVEALKGAGVYKLYPSNPYETVINSRPAISYYNDNNPDWLNIMIFYHVLGHIDFFQNNIMFEHTWNDDFVGKALADKRLIAGLRLEYGRWVDYVIEFSRSIDNLTGYFNMLSKKQFPQGMAPDSKIEYYLGEFLQGSEKVPDHIVYSETERYNKAIDENPETGESVFFSTVRDKYPEFQAMYEKYQKVGKESPPEDILEYIRDHSPFLNLEANEWMKSIINIVRDTGMYFAPQGRSKIINEGWASYWHDENFRADDRIKGHESAYAVINAGVTSISRVGLNPYAIGLRLIQHIEKLANQGKLSSYYQRILNIEERADYDKNTGRGREAIFNLRKYFSDFTLINTFVSQDFVDEYNLFVVGKRLNEQRGTVEYFIKSKKAEDYKQMLLDSLYHPPLIEIDFDKTNADNLFLKHRFEGKELYKPYISDTMMGIEFLWGGQVQLQSVDIMKKKSNSPDAPPTYEFKKVMYTMKDKKLSKVGLL